MVDTLALALMLGLAGFRVTRLLIKDTIFDRQRKHLLRARLPTKLVAGILCPWCVSAYVVGVMLLVVWWLEPVRLPFITWLAAWTTAAVIYRFTDAD